MGTGNLRWRTGNGDRRRRRILRFVQGFGRREGFPPSYREIAGNSGWRYPRRCIAFRCLSRTGPCAAGPASRAPPIPGSRPVDTAAQPGHRPEDRQPPSPASGGAAMPGPVRSPWLGVLLRRRPGTGCRGKPTVGGVSGDRLLVGSAAVGHGDRERRDRRLQLRQLARRHLPHPRGRVAALVAVAAEVDHHRHRGHAG